MVRGFCILLLLVLAETQAGASSRNVRSCKSLLTPVKAAFLSTQTFVTTFRGEPLVVRYQLNQPKLNKRRPLYLVLPGLNMPSFEDKLLSLGGRGEQAISLDLLNIGDVNMIYRPTPEEDAEIVAALLRHLKWTAQVHETPIIVISHSRGALIANRLMRLYWQEFRWGGSIQFNPYVGWIPRYYQVKAAGQSGSLIRESKKWMSPFFPLAHVWMEWAAQWSEMAGAVVSRSLLDAAINLYNPPAARAALSEALGDTDDTNLERVRQKLIGMENAEVGEDLTFLREQGVPVVFVYSDRDEFVPLEMTEAMRDLLAIPGVRYSDMNHYLPYLHTSETTDLALKISKEWLERAQIQRDFE
jgi:pimeloyl-ACP methyl ester carboxylesterase